MSADAEAVAEMKKVAEGAPNLEELAAGVVEAVIGAVKRLDLEFVGKMAVRAKFAPLTKVCEAYAAGRSARAAAAAAVPGRMLTEP